MVNFSQTFVVYHGCGNGYLDGTRTIVPENKKKCIRPTIIRFGKSQLMFVIEWKQEHNLNKKK